MSDWTLYLGDALEGLREFPAGSVGVTLTDPPYDKKTHSRGGAAVKRFDGGPDIPTIPFAPLEAAAPIAQEIARVTSRWALVFCAVRQIEEWSVAFEAADWNVVRVLVWVKPDASPQFSGDRPGHGYETIVLAHPVGRTRWNGGGLKGVYECPRMDRESGFLHPTQKPLKLIERLVRDFTEPGELVCDPFAGSGTTLVACKKLGRRAVGWEIDPAFHATATRRLHDVAPGFWAKPKQQGLGFTSAEAPQALSNSIRPADPEEAA